MQQHPLFTPLAASLPDSISFIAPEGSERRTGITVRARIGANESGFGPSPKAIAAMEAAASEAWKYGDPENYNLTQALARFLGVPPENVGVGEGIDGLQAVIARLIIEPGDVFVNSLGGYPMFSFYAEGLGARTVHVPYAGDHEDLDGLLAAVRREKAKVVFLCNPDNPMGTWWPAEEISRFIHALPETTLLLLDEAYGEIAPPGTMPPLDISRPNVIRTRTFSKAYGLAGMRVGYAIGDARFIKAFDKFRNHFGVGRTSQIGALEALADQDYLQSVLARNVAARSTIAGIAKENGLTPIASATNFVTLDCGRDGAFAVRVLNALAARGVFIRKPWVPPLDRCIRVSTGPEAELAIFAAELPGALKQAS